MRERSDEFDLEVFGSRSSKSRLPSPEVAGDEVDLHLVEQSRPQAPAAAT
ncbi:MAG: hypothetical protein M3499_07260 [Actinomycetota bacterium]|nr:hypothetical protein [Actinomycetota bacterium]